MKLRILKKLKNAALTVTTAAAGYLLISAIDIALAPEWEPYWIPGQISMFVVGAAWLIAFAVANGYFGGKECTTEE